MSQNTRGLIVAAVLFGGWLLASRAGAQGTTATVVGTITDSSGGALPGTLVTARNADTTFGRGHLCCFRRWRLFTLFQAQIGDDHLAAGRQATDFGCNMRLLAGRGLGQPPLKYL